MPKNLTARPVFCQWIRWRAWGSSLRRRAAELPPMRIVLARFLGLPGGWYALDVQAGVSRANEQPIEGEQLLPQRHALFAIGSFLDHSR